MNGSDIKAYRDKHNLTQEQLAAIVKVSIRAVQSWEQNQRNVTQSAITLMQTYEDTQKGIESVSMPREVFDQISRLTETVLSQQRTIETLTQKGGASVAGAARRTAIG